ncbi:hypothetical protein [Xanthomonas oryzae pv. oryzae MAFF 311018]|nr:hypothetical protein [Xanthomonas oryzae pv. oryzae MAFF 311018]
MVAWRTRPRAHWCSFQGSGRHAMWRRRRRWDRSASIPLPMLTTDRHAGVLIAELGGCLPAASMLSLFAAGRQPSASRSVCQLRADCRTLAYPGRRVGRCR